MPAIEAATSASPIVSRLANALLNPSTRCYLPGFYRAKAGFRQ
jgi:hypothetical protein